MASKNRNSAQLAQQKENYKALRAAGFSTQEASRLRSASQAKVDAALRTGTRPAPISERARAAGKHEKFNTTETTHPYGVHKGRIKAEDYTRMGEGEVKMYYSRYAYLMEYVVRMKDGTPETKYLTITSDTKLSKKELKAEVVERCNDPDEGEYEGVLVKSSVQLVEAYENPNM